MPNFKTGTVIYHANPASTYYDVIVKADQPLQYIPGQFVSIKVADRKVNPYSIASIPEPNHFRLIIDNKPGGAGSQFFTYLKIGDTIQFLGPLGRFTLKPTEAAEYIFLATGSGIAPLRTMIEHLLQQEKTTKPVKLYFGLRHPQDIFWQNTLKQLVDQHPNFTYKITLSRPDDQWQGQTGYITDHLKADFSDTSNAVIYICGGKEMIEQASKLAQSLGTPKAQIHYERFW